MDKAREKYLSADDILELYKNNIREILAFVSGYIKNEEDARDAIQDIFYKLYEDVRRRKIYNINPRAYLYKTARNHCIDLLRKKKARYSSVELDTIENFPNGTTENGLIDSLLLDSIYEYVDESLPEKEAAVFKLKYFYRLNLEEISEIMETSVSSLSRMLGKIVKGIVEEFPNAV